MSLQLILGGSGSGKSYQLYKKIIDQSKENLENNFLLIVPEQFTLQTQKDIVEMHPNKGTINIDVLSFLRFSFRIFDELGANTYPILEDTGKTMILRKIIEAKKKDLDLFNINAKKPGFINELKSLLSEIYQYSIGRDELEDMKRATQKKPVLNAKIRDIITIYEGFENYIDEKYIAAEEVLDVLFKVIEESNWLKNSIICLDGFTGFTPSQNKILGKMMKLAKKTYITVTIDPREKIEEKFDDHKLFGLSLKTIDKLYKIAHENNVKIEQAIYGEQANGGKAIRFKESPALGFLEENLFRYPYKVFQEKQEDIVIRGMKTTLREVEYVSREIKTLIQGGQYRYRDIAIITGDIGLYTPLIKRIFGQEKIPCFIDNKRKILDNPFAEILRAAVAIVADNFSYESIFRYLKTGFTNLKREEIDVFENYVIACGIRGQKMYKQAFFRTHPSLKALDLERVEAIRIKFYKEIEPLHIVLKDKKTTVEDKTRELYDLGLRLNLEEKLKKYKINFEQEDMLIEAKEYQQIYQLVMDLYDQMVLLLGDEPCTAKEFGEILDAGLSEGKIGIIPPGIDEVMVGDTQRTRLKDIKVLFFIGVNEGIVPKTGVGGGIFSELEREILVKNNFDLAPTKRQVAFTEQFYTYLNMTKPKNKLYISFHKLNSEGKTIRPSYVVKKIMQLYKHINIYEEDVTIKDPDFILRDGGLEYLIQGLRNYPQKPLSDIWKEIYKYYRKDEEKKIIIENLLAGAFYKNLDQGLSKEVASKLYGHELNASVSRLEKFAGCSYSHFLSYGLYLRERPEYKIAIPDIGNIFHNSIESFSKRLEGDKQYNWNNIPEETRSQWALEAVETAVEAYGNTFIRSSKRSEYLIERIQRITVRTLWVLCNHIQQGSFIPAEYEKNFKFRKDKNLLLRGKIDRIDLYEEGDNVHVRVIDYKSGQADFDFRKLYYGLQQQLSVYMEASLDYLAKENPGKNIVPGAIFYYKIDDPIVAKSANAQEDRYKEHKMDGLVNKDGEIIKGLDCSFKDEKTNQFKGGVRSDIIPVSTKNDGDFTKNSKVSKKRDFLKLMEFVSDKLSKDGEKILAGHVSLNPYELGDARACKYCEFKAVCGFDLGLPGHKYRHLAKIDIDDIKKEIWGEEE